MRTSYSQNNTYINCPKHWELRYKHKLSAEDEGASLHFGSAVDTAIEEMLEGKKDYMKTFKDRWKVAQAFGKTTQVYDNIKVVYSHYDFDEAVLNDVDLKQLESWAKELKLDAVITKPKDTITLFKNIAKDKKNPYKGINEDQLRFFARASWLSLERKGELLIQSFKDQFLPKITKVVSTQQRGEIKDPTTGDSIIGYIDMVLEIEGYDKPIIFDLKTAARPYDEKTIELTEQLTLYQAMKGKDYNTNLVGYVVLCKNIPKESVAHCKTCNHRKTGRHKSCDAEINGVRCGGEWHEVTELKPQVQVLVKEKSDEEVNKLLESYGNIIVAMKNNIVYKDVSKCHSWYGGKCPYFEACHNDDFSKLTKR